MKIENCKETVLNLLNTFYSLIYEERFDWILKCNLIQNYVSS